jgi:hypothetical protein
MENDSKQVPQAGQLLPPIAVGEELAPNVASDPTFGYYKLDADQTKAEFALLDAELNQRCEALARAQVTLEDATPFLKKMQALLSQRGDERHTMMKKAGLPTWTQWAKGYADKIGSSVRTLQRHIKELRDGEKICRKCAKKKGKCSCPELCSKCKNEKTACTCIEKLSVQEPYLRALECLVGVADRAADRHEDKELAHAVEFAVLGMSRNERLKLGIQSKPESDLTPEEAVSLFLTQQVRREFLTTITEESELIFLLREMTQIFYDSKKTPESERPVLIRANSTMPNGMWTPERKQAHSELIKAGIARKKAAHAVV